MLPFCLLVAQSLSFWLVAEIAIESLRQAIAAAKVEYPRGRQKLLHNGKLLGLEVETC